MQLLVHNILATYICTELIIFKTINILVNKTFQPVQQRLPYILSYVNTMKIKINENESTINYLLRVQSMAEFNLSKRANRIYILHLDRNMKLFYIYVNVLCICIYLQNIQMDLNRQISTQLYLYTNYSSRVIHWADSAGRKFTEPFLYLVLVEFLKNPSII